MWVPHAPRSLGSAIAHGLAWEQTRILPRGKVSAVGNTRANGVMRDRNGPKHVVYLMVANALAWWGLGRDRPADVTLAARVSAWAHAHPADVGNEGAGRFGLARAPDPMTRRGAVAEDGAAHTRALVRRPGPRLAEGLVTHPIRTPVDVHLAGRQWHGYVDALRAEGWEIIEVPPADDCPDAVFVEDTVVVYGDLAVITRPGADERKPEVTGTKTTLASLGYRITQIEPPGTLDGGDVLKGTGELWVGLSGRTNASGVQQLAELLGPLGARVVGVPVSRTLHLKSSITALPDGTIVGFDPLVDGPARWPTYLSVPEEAGAHVVVLDASSVLMSTRAPATRALFESRGLRVVAVDIAEYEKLDGGVTCLSVRLT